MRRQEWVGEEGNRGAVDENVKIYLWYLALKKKYWGKKVSLIFKNIILPHTFHLKTSLCS